jgi:hypothetical protein
MAMTDHLLTYILVHLLPWSRGSPLFGLTDALQQGQSLQTMVDEINLCTLCHWERAVRKRCRP